MSAGDIERAEVARGFGVFPRSWGVPPGGQFSEERKRWILERITEHRAFKGVQRRAADVAVKAETFERQRYLLLTRER